MTQNPLILAVETSGRLGSVAIALGEKMLGQTIFTGPMRHSTEILPAVGELLDKLTQRPNQIKQIYISAGPGSFTGLRIGVTIAQIMNLANDAKIVTVDTLDCIAANATEFMGQDKADSHKIATILDAKRGQFFVAVYQRDCPHLLKIVPDCLMTAEGFVGRFARGSAPVWLLGEGLLYHKDKFKADGIEFLDESYWQPKASKVHMLGWQKALNNRFADPLTVQPAYLRKPETKEKPQNL